MLEDRIQSHLLPGVMLLSLFQLFFLNCAKIMNNKYWWQQQQEQMNQRADTNQIQATKGNK